jgi:hypothetical protein
VGDNVHGAQATTPMERSRDLACHWTNRIEDNYLDVVPRSRQDLINVGDGRIDKEEFCRFRHGLAQNRLYRSI